MSVRLIVRDERGLPMRVIRPDKPEIPLKIVEECLADNDRERLDNLPTEAEAAGVSYAFVGFLARKRNGKGARLVDEAGNDLGPVAPGDSFVTTRGDSN